MSGMDGSEEFGFPSRERPAFTLRAGRAADLVIRDYILHLPLKAWSFLGGGFVSSLWL